MPEFPTCCLHQSNLPIENCEEIWIALNFQNKSPIEIHRAYIIASNKTNIPFHARVYSNTSLIISRAWEESQANHFCADTRKSDPFHIFWSQNQTVWATGVGLRSFYRFFQVDFRGHQDFLSWIRRWKKKSRLKSTNLFFNYKLHNLEFLKMKNLIHCALISKLIKIERWDLHR